MRPPGCSTASAPIRCVDTPLAEAGILGTAVGLCMAGWRPVCEMQYDAFSYPCLDQLITHVGRYRWRTGGKMAFPITIRMPYGGGVRAPELHDDSPEAYYVHTPGIKVAIPSTPADAKGLLAAAIRDPDPVVIFEPKLVYRTARGEVPDGEYVVPLGQARIAREGTDVTLIAYGAMVGVCELAADALDVSCEVVDIRSLRPLDEDAILASVAKTGRVVIVHEAPRTVGFGAEIAALIAEQAIFDLQGPVLRVTGYDVPYPYWTIEDAYMPSVERVVGGGALAARDPRAPARARNLHGHFSRDLPPVLTIDAGRLGAIPTPNAGWGLDGRTSVRAADGSRGRRPCAGRARSRCAARAPGRRSPCASTRSRPGPWGVTLTEPPHSIDWELAGDTGRASTGHVVTLRPFLGVLGDAAGRARACIRRSRRGRRAATSTARSSSPARRSTCRSRSTARSSRPATVMRRRATAR